MELSDELEVGLPTLKDIIEELEKPGRVQGKKCQSLYLEVMF